MRRPRYIIERLLPHPPHGAARTIGRCWIKIGLAGRLAAAERILINAMTDTGDRVRIRQVRA